MKKNTLLTMIALIALIALFTVSCGNHRETPAFTGIYLASLPTETKYEVGELFSPAGMTVKAIFSDGTEKVVTDYTYDKMAALTLSDTLVTVSYNGKTVGLKISVSEAEQNEQATAVLKFTCGENGAFTAKKNNTDFPMTSGAAYTIENGAEIRVTVKANDGYRIKAYTENGKTIDDFTGLEGAAISYAVTEDYDIAVTFESRDDNVTYQRSTAEVTVHFKSYFYDESGNVKCNKLEGFSSAEWVVGARDGIIPFEVFKDITGMDVSVSESYSYKFVSSDGQSTISITGTINASDNAEYATIRVSIPSCPEIQVIHVGSEQYFNGVNSEGVPVIFIGN